MLRRPSVCENEGNAPQLRRFSLGSAREPGMKSETHDGSPYLLPLAVAAIIAGCGAGWRRADVSVASLPPRQQIQVWTQGRAVQWHDVRITEDALSGVPFFRPLGCDSCRQVIARGAVDSVRVGNPTAGFWKSVGLGVGALVAFCMVFCQDPGST